MDYKPRQKWQIKKMWKRIREERRKPYLYEWDIFIDYYYPPYERNHNKIESDLDPKPMKKVLDHTVHMMFDSEEEKQEWIKNNPGKKTVEKVYRWMPLDEL